MTTTPPPDPKTATRERLQRIAETRARLDAEQTEAVLDAVRAGWLHREVASFLGVSRQRVGQIVTDAHEAMAPPDVDHGA